jgi:hypothetical protein
VTETDALHFNKYQRSRVHTGFENLQRNCTPNRLLLLGQEDDAKAAFADRFQNLVGADVAMFPFAIPIRRTYKVSAVSWAHRCTCCRSRRAQSSLDIDALNV